MHSSRGPPLNMAMLSAFSRTRTKAKRKSASHLSAMNFSTARRLPKSQVTAPVMTTAYTIVKSCRLRPKELVCRTGIPAH